jgi:hypothetical protein
MKAPMACPRFIGVVYSLILSCFLLCGVSFSSANSQDDSLSADKLDRTIREVIQKREYQWRLPRQHKDNAENSVLLQTIEDCVEWMNRAFRWVAELWQKFVDAIRRSFRLPPPDIGSPSAKKGHLDLLITLLIAVAVLLALLIWRIVAKKKTATAAVSAAPILIKTHLMDENVSADQMPETGWYALAQDLLKRGELRLALRAFYLAILAFLAESEMIRIAKYKSNRDYQRELQRKARERQDVLDAFAENVILFERAWYGSHEVTEDSLELFESNHDRIKTIRNR